MRSSRFKPGDNIVIVAAGYGEDYRNGNRGVVELYDDNYEWWMVGMDMDERGNRPVYEEEMELAEIADSPLYRALL